MRTRTTQEIQEAEERVAAAKAKYDNQWWDSDDPKVLFWGQLNEPCLIIEFGKFHEAAEKALERPVWTHEFAYKDSLVDEFKEKTPKATIKDVIGKMPADKPVIVVQT